MDYCLLVFESSLGSNSQFNYNDASCSVYQLMSQGSPLLSAGTIILLIFHVHSVKQTPISTVSPASKVFLMITLLIISVILISLPSLVFSRLAVIKSGAANCVMDLSVVSSWAGLPQLTTSAYYLFYKAVLPFWLPVGLAIAPIIGLTTQLGREEDKLQCSLNLALLVGISHAVFNLPHAVTVTVRYLMVMSSVSLSSHTMWILDVTQSLFLLISFFCHLFRPLACLMVDQELTPITSLCRGTNGYTTVTTSRSENKIVRILD